MSHCILLIICKLFKFLISYCPDCIFMSTLWMCIICLYGFDANSVGILWASGLFQSTYCHLSSSPFGCVVVSVRFLYIFYCSFPTFILLSPWSSSLISFVYLCVRLFGSLNLLLSHSLFIFLSFSLPFSLSLSLFFSLSLPLSF